MTESKVGAALLRGGALALALAAGVIAGGCAPAVVGGAIVGSGMVYADRRTSGAQLEDQNIELKASGALGPIGDRAHVSVTSYNRMVLITGEVPDEADRVAAEQALARLENVRSTVNELAVMGNSSYTSRSNDAILLSKVKAAHVGAEGLPSNAIKVVVERGNAYLLGRVTEREAQRAAELARGVDGVHKVIRVFEILTEAELAALQPK
jgi:osmotically-inducible protein OsmY